MILLYCRLINLFSS